MDNFDKEKKNVLRDIPAPGRNVKYRKYISING